MSDIGLICILGAGIAFGWGAGVFVWEGFWRRQSVEKGYALYDPKTGKWKWKDDETLEERR